MKKHTMKTDYLVTIHPSVSFVSHKGIEPSYNHLTLKNFYDFTVNLVSANPAVHVSVIITN